MVEGTTLRLRLPARKKTWIPVPISEAVYLILKGRDFSKRSSLSFTTKRDQRGTSVKEREKIITPAEMRRIEALAIKAGEKADLFMKKAGEELRAS